MRAVVYLRISDDQDGQQTATGRQKADCLALCEREGWEVAAVFEDADYSGYSGKTRPDFERMLDAIRAGDVDRVVAWKIDRLYRNLRDLVRLDEDCTAAGAVIRTIADGVDTSTPSGQMVATMLVAQGRMESANTSTRVKRAIKQAAQDGKPKRGKYRCLGYDREMTAIIPAEAAIIREVVKRIIEGEAIHAITCDLNRRGSRTSEGNEWRIRNLVRTVTSATVSGQREYLGQLMPGIWPAIITPDELARVRAITRSKAKVGRPARSPLAGLLRCGLCGHSLSHWGRGGQPRRYRCGTSPGTGNCGHIVIGAEPVEDAIRDAVLVRMEEAELPTFEAQDTAVDDVLEAERRLDELGTDYANKLIAREAFLAAQAGMSATLEAARTALAKRPAATAPVTRLNREAWDSLSVDERRAVAGQLLDNVAVGAAVKLGRVQDVVGRLTFTWRL